MDRDKVVALILLAMNVAFVCINLARWSESWLVGLNSFSIGLIVSYLAFRKATNED